MQIGAYFGDGASPIRLRFYGPILQSALRLCEIGGQGVKIERLVAGNWVDVSDDFVGVVEGAVEALARDLVFRPTCGRPVSNGLHRVTLNTGLERQPFDSRIKSRYTADLNSTSDDVDVAAFVHYFNITTVGGSANGLSGDIAGPGPTPGADGECTSDDIILFMSWYTGAALSTVPYPSCQDLLPPQLSFLADYASAGPVFGRDCQLTADDIIAFIQLFVNEGSVVPTNFIGCQTIQEYREGKERCEDAFGATGRAGQTAASGGTSGGEPAGDEPAGEQHPASPQPVPVAVPIIVQRLAEIDAAISAEANPQTQAALIAARALISAELAAPAPTGPTGDR